MVDIVTTPGRGPGLAHGHNGSSALDLAGRVLLAAIFVSSGVSKLLGWPGVVGQIASKGLPLPEVAGAIAIFVELAGAAALITGFGLRLGALALAAFTLAAAVLFHDFWARDASQYMNQFNHFMKAIAMAGGLLVVAARPLRGHGGVQGSGMT